MLGTGIKVGPGMCVERLNTTLKIRKVSTQSTQSLLQIAILMNSIEIISNLRFTCTGILIISMVSTRYLRYCGGDVQTH